MDIDYSVASWNLRGLNNPARRNSICLFLQSFNLSLICAQESELELVDSSIISQTFGPAFDGFDFVPALGTRGGIILAWRTDHLRISILHKGDFSITAEVQSLNDAKAWAVTSVYGPQQIPDKELFIQELLQIGASMNLPWIVNGDFNLVLDQADKSNGRVNRRLMNKFKHAINSLALQDMPLQGRKYTWSNEQEEPILARLDRVLFNPPWEDLYPISDLTALSTDISDHCPLLMTCSATRPRSFRFRFENFWPKLPGFAETVKSAWESAEPHADPLFAVDCKLKATAKALRSWGQRKQSQLALLFQIANEVILRLDEAREARQLTDGERRLRAFLKGKCLALASLERTRLRQRARVRDLREGDANSKYFHMKANARRRKHLIPILRLNDKVATTIDDKLDLATEYFSGIIGSVPLRQLALNLDALQLPSLTATQARSLGAPFTKDEVKKIIMEMPSERAPGPEGFSGLFFKTCWEVIGDDFVPALEHLHKGQFRNFRRLNSSILILLPKKENPMDLKDYRSISLIQS
jgi:exonuclease III